MTDVEILQSIGGKVGSKLSGDEGFGAEVIQVTAIGETEILAKRIRNTKGEKTFDPEGRWTLQTRDWKIV